MSEQFNDKDYSEYFSAIEKSIERKTKPIEKATQKQETEIFEIKKIKLKPLLCIAVALAIVLTVVLLIPKKDSNVGAQLSSQDVNSSVIDVEKPQEPKTDYFATYTENTEDLAGDIVSQNVIVINCGSNEVVAARNASERCYPASTTKIMTVLTAVDYITDYNDTFTFSYEVTDPFYEQGATIAGFKDKEAVNMTDMLYGAILPSGADATAGLAIKIAGSEQAFVELMNKKAQELKLKDTHFTNASGLFDKNHYTTPEDMAVIIRAAMQNDLCKKILSTYQYTTAPTEQNPDGILLTSTLFSHMYGTEPEGSDILGGKTGYVDESGYCIASFGKSDGGTEYVCVTFKGNGLWPTVYDQINIYTRYAK